MNPTTMRKSSRTLLPVLGAVAGLLAFGWATVAPAETTEPNACRTAIRAAEARYEIPADLLLAIGMLESGLNPFALNVAGRPKLPDNVAAAELMLVDDQGNHVKDLAVGCMQVHVRWHLAAFDNKAQLMLDAAANVDYAARYLRQLYDSEGSWRRAVGRYNAGKVGGAAYERYICLVDSRLKEINSELRLDCRGA